MDLIYVSGNLPESRLDLRKEKLFLLSRFPTSRSEFLMFKTVRSSIALSLVLVAVTFTYGVANAQQFGGLLGVYAKETGRGLLVTGFIPGSSADELNRVGEMMVGDVMLRLDGRALRRGADVFKVTDLLEAGADYVDLEMMTRTGQLYLLAITPTAGQGIGGAQPYSYPVNGKVGNASPQATVNTRIVVKESRNRGNNASQSSENQGQSKNTQRFLPTRRPRD
jgi:hypothetical protein